jgi:flagellar L-ring protein FlgH
MKRATKITGLVLAACLSMSPAAQAEDLFKPNQSQSLISDQRARQIGDSLTVMIYENARGSSGARDTGSKKRDISGNINLGQVFNESGKINFDNEFAGRGQVERSGSLVAQMSVVVSDVLDNGDLRVVGENSLRINGEKTKIKVRGRVRAQDVSDMNTIASFRLADAEISYDGSGFVTRNAKPGLLTRIFNWMGLW